MGRDSLDDGAPALADGALVVPQFVPRRQWHNALHAQTAMMLRLALVFEPGVVITSVPYQVGGDEEEEE